MLNTIDAQRFYANEMRVANRFILRNYEVNSIESGDSVSTNTRSLPTAYAVSQAIAAAVLPLIGSGDTIIVGNFPTVTTTETSFNEANLDAFGALKVSQPFTQFELKHFFNKDSISIVESLTSNATSTYSNIGKYVDLTVDTVLGSKAIRQSRRCAIYQAGKGLRVEATGIIDIGNNSTAAARIGLFDNNNGFFFMDRRDSLFVVKRSNVSGAVVDSAIYIDDWNGDMSYNVNKTQAQIFFIDFQYLGVGQVRMGFIQGLTLHIVHTFRHTNTSLVPYAAQINLPIRYEVEQLQGGGSYGALRMICAVAISDGGFLPIGKTYSYSSGTAAITTTGNVQKILGGFKADSSYMTINPINLDVLVNTNNNITVVDVWLCSATSGGSWVAQGYNNLTKVNTDISSYTPLAKVASMYISNINRSASILLQDRVYTGTSFSGNDIIVLTCTTTANSDVYWNLEWQEIY
jgi:hypothetical protein